MRDARVIATFLIAMLAWGCDEDTESGVDSGPVGSADSGTSTSPDDAGNAGGQDGGDHQTEEDAGSDDTDAGEAGIGESCSDPTMLTLDGSGMATVSSTTTGATADHNPPSGCGYGATERPERVFAVEMAENTRMQVHYSATDTNGVCIAIRRETCPEGRQANWPDNPGPDQSIGRGGNEYTYPASWKDFPRAETGYILVWPATPGDFDLTVTVEDIPSE